MEIFQETWLWQFIFGMYLGYLVLSPRLRGFTWRTIVWSVHGLNYFVNWCNGVKAPVKVAEPVVSAKPARTPRVVLPEPAAEPVFTDNKRVVVATMDDLERYLKNPDVKVSNRSK